jgi:quinol monooxygenase YgiN
MAESVVDLDHDGLRPERRLAGLLVATVLPWRGAVDRRGAPTPGYDRRPDPEGGHRMSEVVVVGSFKAQPGKEAEAAEAFKALVEPTHREDGCILYALHQGSDDPSRLAFIERWRSRELLDAHLESPHIAAVLQRAEELFGDSADITVYEPVPGGETKKGSLAAHAGD